VDDSNNALNGKGVERNPAKALTLAEKSCTLAADDCQWLGFLNMKGQLGTVRYEAARYFHTRCHMASRRLLQCRTMMENGAGMDVDYAAPQALRARVRMEYDMAAAISRTYEKGKRSRRSRARRGALR